MAELTGVSLRRQQGWLARGYGPLGPWLEGHGERKAASGFGRGLHFPRRASGTRRQLYPISLSTVGMAVSPDPKLGDASYRRNMPACDKHSILSSAPGARRRIKVARGHILLLPHVSWPPSYPARTVPRWKGPMLIERMRTKARHAVPVSLALQFPSGALRGQQGHRQRLL